MKVCPVCKRPSIEPRSSVLERDGVTYPALVYQCGHFVAEAL